MNIKYCNIIVESKILMSKDKNKNFEMKKRLLNFIAKIDDSQNIEQILFDLKESLNEFKPKHKKLFKN